MRRIDGESETFVTHSLRADGFDASEDGSGRGTPLVPVAFRACGQDGFTPTEIAPPITSTDGGGSGVPTVAFQESQSGCREYDSAGSLRAHGPGHDPVGTRVRSGMAVRRLTPTECERLQGFPDGYTQVPYRGRSAADGPRYKALGNSMAVPVMRWILSRIVSADES